MNREPFDSRIAQLASAIGGRPLDAALTDFLNRDYGAGSTWFQDVRQACERAIEEGWMCDREAGGIRYGRVTKPETTAGPFSVDVVSMSDCRGPWHVHPEGEIDMIMPLEGEARFDGHGAGWVVYPPGSAHYPTVSGGCALVLYLLPSGRIEFTSPG